MKCLKIIKFSGLIGATVSLFSALVLAVLSGLLQHDYKGRIGGPDTAELLAKKKFWANVAESDIFLYLFYIALGFLVVFIVAVIISAILKKRNKLSCEGQRTC